MATGSVPWHKVQTYVKDKLERARGQMESAADQAEFLRLQGEIRAYKALLNLPEALALVDEEDRRAAAAAQRRAG